MSAPGRGLTGEEVDGDRPVGVTVAHVRADNPGPLTLTGTNSYVLRAGEAAWAVDPGPDDPAHLGALVAALDGAREVSILLTHRHADHTAGAPALHERLERLLGLAVPVLAVDTSVVRGSVPPPSVLCTGGGTGVLAEVIAVPGHTADSIALLLADGSLLTGDTVLGGSPGIVSPPDGSLTDLLASLRRLHGLCASGRARRILPGHGEPVEGADAAAAWIEHLIAHRERRIAQVRAARETGAAGVDEFVRAIYGDDLDATLRRGAEGNVRAALDHLDRIDRLDT
ncbi:MBL fold metallo-hydrolase [Brachybacterium huguangmaarense]